MKTVFIWLPIHILLQNKHHFHILYKRHDHPISVQLNLLRDQLLFRALRQFTSPLTTACSITLSFTTSAHFTLGICIVSQLPYIVFLATLLTKNVRSFSGARQTHEVWPHGLEL